jgi:CDP-glycerol glycerophosphotransferase
LKIDTKNPFHWLYLVVFSLNTLAAAILRPFVRRKSGGLVLLYGHKLNSNLKAVYDFSRNSGETGPALCFLTIDPGYYRELKTAGERVFLATNPLNIIKIAGCDVIVSDHGLHALKLLLRFSNIRFVDVWHGIPFKGFDADDFRTQHQYSEIWLTSDLLKELYATKFGFDRSLLHATGYARTDVLVNRSADCTEIRERLGIPASTKKIILFAPTWQQDESNRNIFPFGATAEVFFNALESLCDRLSVSCVFRTHLNSRAGGDGNHRNIFYAPHAMFPDTEEVLLACDLLVCDWSSIAFDYLLLDRPTVFLDVKAPFKKGFSLDESYRFGEVVESLDGMIAALEAYIRQPETYWSAHGEQCRTVKKALYDSNADGHAASRCYKRLERLVSGLTDS